MKKNRQLKILDIISKYEVETQEELLDYLQKENFCVTQATVSRDIRDLDLVKITTSKGTYKYTTAHISEHESRKRSGMGASVVTSLQSVDCAQNILVLKTLPGMSAALAVEIDSLSEPKILGCVAGDDTIIVVVKDNDSARELCVRMRELLSDS